MKAALLALKPRYVAVATFIAAMVCYLHVYYFPLPRELYALDDGQRYDYYTIAFFRISYWLPMLLFMLWLAVFIVHYNAARLANRLLHFFKPMDLILCGVAVAILFLSLSAHPDLLPRIIVDLLSIQDESLFDANAMTIVPMLNLLTYIVPGLFFTAAISLWIMQIGHIDQEKSKKRYGDAQDERITQFLLELRVLQQAAQETGNLQAEQTYKAVRQLAENTLK